MKFSNLFRFDNEESLKIKFEITLSDHNKFILADTIYKLKVEVKVRS